MKPAIQELMDDHVLILRMLDALRGMCLRIDAKGSFHATDLEEAVAFIRDFADHAHHGKEEDLLFPAMERAGFPRHSGPLAVMLYEHEQGRALVARMADASSRLKAGRAEAGAHASLAASGYAQLLAAHIFKEDRILYPMAMDAIPAPVWEDLTKEFARVEAERMGARKRQGYTDLVERLVREYPAPPAPAQMGCHGPG